MIKRALTDSITNLAKQYPVISLTGPRQSGKTTLVNEIFTKYSYYNLEIPETRAFAQTDPAAFIIQSERMIIDEIQYAPELLSYIQGAVDNDNTRRFVITGSQNFLISEKVSQSLAGRVAILNLLPLSLNELTNAHLSDRNLIGQIHKGFYPRVYNQKMQADIWYDNYIQTYLERDVRLLKNIGNLSLFQKFMGLLAGRTAQILNLTSLAGDVGVSVPTISQWITILEASYIVFRLPPYYESWNKRLTKAPKLHFIDSGLVCALLNINSAKELENHPLLGHIFESFVVAEYLKKNINQKMRAKLYYWREKNGKEIDLLLDETDASTAIEVKLGQTYSPDQTKNLLYYQKVAKKPTQLMLVNGGITNQKRTEFEIVSWKKIV